MIISALKIPSRFVTKQDGMHNDNNYLKEKQPANADLLIQIDVFKLWKFKCCYGHCGLNREDTSIRPGVL